MLKTFVSLLVFACLSLAGYCQQTAAEIVQEGIELHNKAAYTEALAKYDEAIKMDKGNFLALYEKSYTLMNLKRYDEAIEICKSLVEQFPRHEQLYLVYINYGSCLDYTGKPEESIKIYNTGIKKFPGVYMLHFNKAITLYSQKEYEEAMKSARQAVGLNPYHASSHNIISVLQANNKIYSLLASLMFLAIEPNSSRSAIHLKAVQDILVSNVKKTGEKQTTITLSMPSENASENNFRPIEMFMSLSSAMNDSEKYKSETGFQRFDRNLKSIIAMLGEKYKDNKGFAWEFYARFFSILNKDQQLDNFTHIIYASAKDPENDVWLKEHKDAVKEFRSWLENFPWK